MSVFRLVSENTIEEKIVERAQQKLKLDAMVVQQGRLKDADKVSKEEIMAAVRFGADTVFRSEESTITDDDIDVILERGKAKTKELQEKITKAEKGDLLDFKLDGGISAHPDRVGMTPQFDYDPGPPIPACGPLWPGREPHSFLGGGARYADSGGWL